MTFTASQPELSTSLHKLEKGFIPSFEEGEAAPIKKCIATSSSRRGRGDQTLASIGVCPPSRRVLRWRSIHLIRRDNPSSEEGIKTFSSFFV